MSSVRSAAQVGHFARAPVLGRGHAAGRPALRPRLARRGAAGPGRPARSVRRPSAAQPQPPPRPNDGPSVPYLQTVAAFTYERLPPDIYGAPADSGGGRRGSGQAVELQTLDANRAWDLEALAAPNSALVVAMRPLPRPV